MFIVALWTLFAVAIAVFIVAVVGAICSPIDRRDHAQPRSAYSAPHNLTFGRIHFGVYIAAAVVSLFAIPLSAWGASYLYASGRCDSLDGQFRTWANRAGWECVLSEDFGPLPVEQNHRIDIPSND